MNYYFQVDSYLNTFTLYRKKRKKKKESWEVALLVEFLLSMLKALGFILSSAKPGQPQHWGQRDRRITSLRPSAAKSI